MVKQIKRLSLLVLLLSGMMCKLQAQDLTKRSFILDADTGNEVDDYFAIARALIEPSWDIICLNATQWEASHWAVSNSMENSHRLNQVLLGEMNMVTPTKRGGINRMFDWGDMAQHSAASYEIINQCKQLQDGEQLSIIALGALTNIASAIYIDPSIESKIKLYWLGTTFNFEQEILKRQDFNCMMDQQAVENILMSDLELHIIPVNIAAAMRFTFAETSKNLVNDSKLSRILLDRWFTHLDGGRKNRTIWDLALIQAMIHPDMTRKKSISMSKDYNHRLINFFEWIDADKMKDEFFTSLNNFINKSND